MPVMYKDWAPMACDTKGLLLDDKQDWYVAACVTRDSDSVTRANWKTLTSDAPEGSEEHRFGHWACGWLEILLVAPEHVSWAEGWEAALSDYPVASDSDLSEVESEDEHEAWQSYGCTDYCLALAREHGCERAVDLLTADDVSRLWCDSEPEVEHDSSGPCLHTDRQAEKTERSAIASVARYRRALSRLAKLGLSGYDGRHLRRDAVLVVHTKPYERTYMGEDLTADGVVVYGSWSEAYEGIRFMEGHASP